MIHFIVKQSFVTADVPEYDPLTYFVGENVQQGPDWLFQSDTFKALVGCGKILLIGSYDALRTPPQVANTGLPESGKKLGDLATALGVDLDLAKALAAEHLKVDPATLKKTSVIGQNDYDAILAEAGAQSGETNGQQ